MKNNDSKIEGIFNSYLINFRFNEKYTKYELDLKTIKKVLQDLSILLCYDLEPCHEIICAKYSNINGISYPFFKECLYNFLEKKEEKLNTMFLAEQHSIPLLDAKNLEYKNEFKEVYNKYKETITGDNILENEILVEENKIPKILENIFNVGKFGLINYNDDFKEIIANEIKLFDRINVDENIINDFMKFVNENRQKYNYIFKEKKINRNFKLEDFIDFIPQGQDELTKIVMETEGNQDNKLNEKDKDKDNISEVILPKNNFDKESNEEIKENNEEKEEDQVNTEIKLIEKKKKLKPKTILRRPPSFHSEDENQKKVQYSKSYIYIESLLLILADFISDKNKDKSYIIIDFGGEYRNELRTLFDNEILGRLGEEVQYEVNKNKLELLKDLLINKAKIEKNINNYEDLLYKMRAHKQNVDFVLITINTKNTKFAR